MARAEALALAFAAALVTTAARAADLAVEQDDVTRHNLRLTAEAIVHHGKPMLSVRIFATDLRDTRMPLGARDLVRVEESGTGPAYLPITVDCDKAVLEYKGRSHAPDRESLCVEPAALPAPRSMPIFLAFALPDDDKVRQVRLALPVTVSRPAPPVVHALSQTPPPPRPVDESLLGPQVLVATIHLR